MLGVEASHARRRALARRRGLAMIVDEASDVPFWNAMLMTQK
jgi:hypothetical protein